MEILRSLDEIKAGAGGAVIAIGNFDGVHRGHQILLDQARQKAIALGKPFGVLTFEPHPRALFRPDEPPFRITPFPVKADRLARTEVDRLYALKFDWDFASLTAEDFVKEVLIDGLNPAHVIVGYDFCFGQLRKGSPKTIEQSGLPVTVIEKISDEQEAYSSSRIRQSLRHGKIHEANRLLGWDWYMTGTVRKGDQRGRELGYPTANIPMGDTVHPAYGVYASRVRIGDDKTWLDAVTNIGIRPMFEIPQAQVETFIFDFDQDIYGKSMDVQPVKRLRGEAKFPDLETLKAQMARDCSDAKDALRA